MEVRLNIRTMDIEFRRSGGPWGAPDDAAAAALREEVAERFCYVSENRGETVPLRFGKDAWYDAVNAISHEQRVDPFLDWIASLSRWDGENRLDFWMEQCWSISSGEGGTPPELVHWASQHLFLAPIWRAKHPGCKLDEIVVLVGPPGIGKSTALAFMFPELFRAHWFTNQFDFLARRQTCTETLLGSVIAEASEMAGSTRAENAMIKAFLSGAFDKIRLAYRRNAQIFPRRCIVVGTADQDDVLPNDPNLRRFVVVVLGQSGTQAETLERVRRYLDRHRSQLWAEALARYEASVTTHLPHELVDSQRAVAEKHRHRNAIVEDAIAGIDCNTVKCGITVCQLIKICGLKDATSTAIGSALRTLGWSKRRVKTTAGRQTLWSPPPE